MTADPKGYYGALGLSPEASGDEIRRVYEALAKIYHWDVNSDPAAAQTFRRITAAYGVLGDPKERAAYDTIATLCMELKAQRETPPGEPAAEPLTASVPNMERHPSHVEAWLHELPKRWARNGFLLGVFSALLGLLVSDTPLPPASVVSAWIFISLKFVAWATLCAVLGLIAGLAARHGLRRSVRFDARAAAARIHRKYIAAALMLSIFFLLAKVFFRSNGSSDFPGQEGLAYYLGYVTTTMVLFALPAFVTSLVSRWGLARAIHRDGGMSSRPRRDPSFSGAVAREEPKVSLPPAMPPACLLSQPFRPHSKRLEAADPSHAEKPDEPLPSAFPPLVEAPQLSVPVTRSLSGAPAIVELPQGPVPGASTRSRNFFVRQWRGELSLGWSYWGVAVVGNILVVVATGLVVVLFSTDKGYDPMPTFWFHLSVWGIVFAVSVWRIVGTWRSATNHAQRRRAANRGTGWAIAAKVMLVLSVVHLIVDFGQEGEPQLSELFDMAFLGDPSLPDYALRVMRDGTEIEIMGGIKYGLAADFERALNTWPNIRVVHLTSPGGRLGEAQKLRTIISDRGLDTYVSKRCGSACTLVFASGRSRWLLEGAKLGFHGPYFPGQSDWGLMVATASWKEDFLELGIDPAFIDRALDVPHTEIWYPSKDELVKARVVTHGTDGSAFAMSGYGIGVMPDDIISRLTKAIPILATIQERLPEKYQGIVQTYHDAYLQGLTLAEWGSQLRASVAVLIKDAMPQADDDVLMDMARYQLEVYKYLRRYPGLCYQMEAGISQPDLTQILPHALLERGLDLGERVLRTRAVRPPADQQVMEALYERLGSAMQQRFGAEKLKIFEMTQVPPSMYTQYCDMTIAIYQEIFSMKPDEAVILIRDM